MAAISPIKVKNLLIIVLFVISVALLGLIFLQQALRYKPNPIYFAISKTSYTSKPVKFSDLNPGNWEMVCFIPEYSLVSKKLAQLLNKPELAFAVKPTDIYVSENNWAIAFIKKTKVEAFEISGQIPFPPGSGTQLNKENSCVPYAGSTIRYINKTAVN